MRHLNARMLLFGAFLPAAATHTAAAPKPVNLSIASADARTGQSLTGACFIIDGGSEGCDENNDGQVDFEDIPHGRYAVAETRAPDGYRLRTNL